MVRYEFHYWPSSSVRLRGEIHILGFEGAPEWLNLNEFSWSWERGSLLDVIIPSRVILNAVQLRVGQFRELFSFPSTDVMLMLYRQQDGQEKKVWQGIAAWEAYEEELAWSQGYCELPFSDGLNRLKEYKFTGADPRWKNLAAWVDTLTSPLGDTLGIEFVMSALVQDAQLGGVFSHDNAFRKEYVSGMAFQGATHWEALESICRLWGLKVYMADGAFHITSNTDEGAILKHWNHYPNNAPDGRWAYATKIVTSWLNEPNEQYPVSPALALRGAGQRMSITRGVKELIMRYPDEVLVPVAWAKFGSQTEYWTNSIPAPLADDQWNAIVESWTLGGQATQTGSYTADGQGIKVQGEYDMRTMYFKINQHCGVYRTYMRYTPDMTLRFTCDWRLRKIVSLASPNIRAAACISVKLTDADGISIWLFFDEHFYHYQENTGGRTGGIRTKYLHGEDAGYRKSIEASMDFTGIDTELANGGGWVHEEKTVRVEVFINAPNPTDGGNVDIFNNFYHEFTGMSLSADYPVRDAKEEIYASDEDSFASQDIEMRIFEARKFNNAGGVKIGDGRDSYSNVQGMSMAGNVCTPGVDAQGYIPALPTGRSRSDQAAKDIFELIGQRNAVVDMGVEDATGLHAGSLVMWRASTSTWQTYRILSVDISTEAHSIRLQRINRNEHTWQE